MNKDIQELLEKAVQELEKLKQTDPSKYNAFLKEMTPYIKELTNILNKAK